MNKILAAIAPPCGRLYAYLLPRAKERSTWYGALVALGGVGFNVDASHRSLIIAAGVGLAGLISIAFPQSGVLGQGAAPDPQPAALGPMTEPGAELSPSTPAAQP